MCRKTGDEKKRRSENSNLQKIKKSQPSWEKTAILKYTYIEIYIY